MSLHPTVRAAARGDLPEWARVVPERYRHMERVADLLDRWACALDLGTEDRARWRAAGYLHDALKDADLATLRSLVDRDLPDAVLHGPAASARLAADGVDDPELLRAVAWHTLGHPELDRLGRAVYCADFLEPGRRLRKEWRRGLRERMPDDPEGVTREVVRARLRHRIERGRPVRPETLFFWNRLVGGGSWARASEV